MIKKAGSWYSYGDRKIGQGRDSVKDLLMQDKELAQKVEAELREAMKAEKESAKGGKEVAAPAPEE